MKNLICSLLIVLLCFTQALGNEGYQNAMAAGMEKLSEAKEAGDFAAAANHFSRIANAEAEDWLSYYYTAYGFVIASFIEKDSDRRDDYLDLAQAAADSALKISEDNSEITVMQAYIYMARTSISPMLRGMTYGPKTGSTLEKAIAQDEKNPRAYFLRGQNLYYTPSMFGGGADAALPSLEKASTLFEATEACSETFLPSWGEDRNAGLLKKIKQD